MSRLDDIQFPQSCQTLLDAHLGELQARYGMALWMITRVRDESLVVLRVHDNHYGLTQGHRLEWQSSYCVRMVEQGAPRIVSDVTDHPIYRDAPINQELGIGAYIGIPLVDRDNRLFGTLCALDPSPQPASLADALPGLQHDAALISFMLQGALRDAREQRLNTFVEHPDRCDETGLPGREGWNDIFAQEVRHCRDLGADSTVLYLQGPADGDSVTIADSLAALLREQDSVAHLGDNHFGILLADTNEAKSRRVADRIRDALNAKQLLVSLQYESLLAGQPQAN